jgi:hypothetical protein
MIDPKDGQKSVTLSAFTIGFIIACLKLLLSGLEIGSIKLAVFSGGDYAAVVGALGAIYWARRNINSGDK